MSEQKWPIGMRVVLPEVEGEQIPGVPGMAMHQPKPEAVGKYGTLTSYETVSIFGHETQVPVFTLDNGETIAGYECWWEPAENQPKEA